MFNRKIQNWLSYMPMVLIMLGLLYINFHKAVHTLTVEAKSKNTTLYLSGVVRPLGLYQVLSPVEGIAVTIKVPYNEWVKKGDILYVLDSQKLAESFRQSLEDFAKATTSYQNLLFQHNGNNELFKMGLISKIAYMDNTQQLRNSELDLLESKAKVMELLKRVGKKGPDFQNMSTEKIEEILKKPIRRVNIYAPEEGFLLFPSSILGGSDKATKVTRGLKIDEGQIVGLIGNMGGITLDVVVDETALRKFSIGQKATVSGAAFPSLSLQGTVKNINRQADSSYGDSVPTYTLSVIVTRLSQKQRKMIDVGMSAEVSFTTTNPPRIWIPIDAISEKNGEYLVKKIAKTGHIEEVVVVPGTTDETSIEIVKGLSSGDKIVVSH